MTYIYVVCEQANNQYGLAMFSSSIGNPIQAFNDYPSAFAFASSIFQSGRASIGGIGGINAKDLIFPIPLNPSASIPPSTNLTSSASS